MVVCAACGVEQTRSAYSSAQLKKPEGSARCRRCVEQNVNVAASTLAATNLQEDDEPSDVSRDIQKLEMSLASGLVNVKFEKASSGPTPPSPGNTCVICKKALWRHPRDHPNSPMSRAPAGDAVAELVCKHHVHDECMTQYGRDKRNLRPATSPLFPHNVACPECGRSCSMWTTTNASETSQDARDDDPYREMTCTRDLSLIPSDVQPKDLAKHAIFETGGAVRVFEVRFFPDGNVDFQGWRSFRVNSKSLLYAFPKPAALADYVRGEKRRHDKRMATPRISIR